MDAIGAAGAMRGGNRLSPFSAATVRVRDGKRQVQDDPLAESKDLLGGYDPTVDCLRGWPGSGVILPLPRTRSRMPLPLRSNAGREMVCLPPLKPGC